MTHKVAWRAFTLLELMITVTLLTVALSLSTLSVHGMSDQVRLQVAASQISAAYRLALCEATQSGRPRILHCDIRGCMVKQAVFRGGQWLWSSAPRIDLSSKVTMVRIFRWGLDNSAPRSEPPWEIIISPGAMNVDLGFELRLQNGRQKTGKLDGLTGGSELETVNNDS